MRRVEDDAPWEALGARRDVALAGLSRWRIGGPARLVVEPQNAADLRQALQAARAQGLAVVVVGDGSNLLFDDKGFGGVVIRIGRRFGHLDVDVDGRATVGAGAWTPAVVHRLIQLGWSGLVHAIGIPGSFGGLVVMNGGSQRRSVGECVRWVAVMTEEGQVRRLNDAELALAYRSSALQRTRDIVLNVGLQLEPGDRRAMRREALAVLQARRRKFPKNRANCGSVFVSDPSAYASIGPPGQAIEAAGLRGARIGDAQISNDHANFIVNLGQARSDDVLALIAMARERVLERTGVAMAAEVRYLREDGVTAPAHEVAGAVAAHP